MIGIDVSYHNGKIDWKKVKEAGIKFAIIRIGYGMYSNQKDKMFEENYKGAVKNGIAVGIYHYSYAKNEEEARREANLCLMWLGKRKLQLPIYFDIEDNSQVKISKIVLNNMCKTFCNIIESAGYWAGIYSNKYWADNIISGRELGKRYTYWIAQYNVKCTYNGDYAVWQYTSDGKVNGINGRVDMNKMVKNIIQGNNNTTLKKSNEEIAREVIKGLWGNNPIRKQKLEKAGYNYNEVQKIVNNMLRK